MDTSWPKPLGQRGRTVSWTPHEMAICEARCDVVFPATFLGHPWRPRILAKKIRFNAILAISVTCLLGPGGLSDLKAERGDSPNVSSRLLSALREIEGCRAEGSMAPQWTESVQGVRADQAGRLEIMIQTTEITPEVLKEVEASGSAIEIYDPAQHLVQAWIPVDKIREVAALPFIKFLDLPNYGVTNRPSD